jgi:hypothetical protein
MYPCICDYLYQQTAADTSATRTQIEKDTTQEMWNPICVPLFNYSCICDFINDAIKSSDYIESNNVMNDELERMWKVRS